MSDYSILLLPKADYWAWVEAAKEYALKFGVNLTADPETAGRYMGPQQTVTVAGLPEGYPAQGDIRAWFQRAYPNVRVDYLPAASPAELQAALQARVAAGERFGPLSGGFRLRWPTDYARINQPFGANPELYRRWNLPGHEGVDIFAPRSANIYAAADGTVVRVDTYNGSAAAMPYGNSVRLRHRDGYETTYAHLFQVYVRVGDTVQAGQVIGVADSTGNSSGDHLHLTLKKDGATAAGLTSFPRDILDPTPFLVWPQAAVAAEYPWPAGYCLVGVHGRADGPMQEADFAAVSAARIEAVKLLSMARPEDVDRLRAINPRMFILVRLFASFDNRHVTPADFVSWLEADMRLFYDRGVRHFELHNEPNLRAEGWTTSWNNGREFGAWFLEARERFKALFPEALIGYPGLSPGVPIDGLRTDWLAFLSESDTAARTADWIGVHSYWLNEGELNAPAGGLTYLEYRTRFPDKLLFITEFSNVAAEVDKRTKGQQYVRYYQHLRSIPGVGAAFSFVVSASAGFVSETWRNEDGSQTEIPGVVGARSTVVTTPPPP